MPHRLRRLISKNPRGADVELLDRAAAVVGRRGDAADFDAAAVIDGRRGGFFDLDQHVARAAIRVRGSSRDADAAEQAERRQPPLALEHRLVAQRIAGLERISRRIRFVVGARVAGDQHVIDS